MKTIITILIFLLGSTIVMAHNNVVVIPLLSGSNAKTFKNVVTVAKANGDFTNPVDAVISITDATETNRYLMIIGPGVYDLDTQQIVMKEWVSIQGSGQEATRIISAVSTGTDDATSAVVVGSNNVALTNLAVENTGVEISLSITRYTVYLC